MIRIDLSEDADRDLIEIYLYGLTQFGQDQTERYTNGLMAAINVAATNPSFGADYGFVGKGLRRFEYKAHAIYYRSRSDSLFVLRVLHGRMDPGRHLT